MKNRYAIAYWLRTDPQHWEHIKPVYDKLGGYILTKNINIYNYLKQKQPHIGQNMVFVKNSMAARRFLYKNRIRIVVYTGFQQIYWGYSVQVFHGSSDKNYLLTKNLVLMYDLLLLPGKKHLDSITSVYGTRIANRMKLVGYPKFDALVRGEIHDRPLFDNTKPVILYAPTWISQNSGTIMRFSEHGESSLLLWGKRLVRILAPRYNLIIKYHSRINPGENGIYGEINECISETGNEDSVRVVWSSSIAEYMNQADVMISDISAVCYEWMHTGRPIVFANPAPEHYRPSLDPMSSTYAWRAGDVLYNEEDILPVVKANLEHDGYREIRSQLLEYAFHKPDGHATDRQVSEILKLYESVKHKTYAGVIAHGSASFFRSLAGDLRRRLRKF